MSASAAIRDTVVFQPSRIHGSGGFAALDAPAGARLIEYLGERISKEESRRRCDEGNPFVFHLDDEADLDGNVDWNPARWLNHSCEPNCSADFTEGRIWIVALRDIAAGEELTFNYGYDLTDYQDFPCRCGTPGCVGFIVAEEYFPVVRMENPALA